MTWFESVDQPPLDGSELGRNAWWSSSRQHQCESDTSSDDPGCIHRAGREAVVETDRTWGRSSDAVLVGRLRLAGQAAYRQWRVGESAAEALEHPELPNAEVGHLSETLYRKILDYIFQCESQRPANFVGAWIDLVKRRERILLAGIQSHLSIGTYAVTGTT